MSTSRNLMRIALLTALMLGVVWTLLTQSAAGGAGSSARPSPPARRAS